MSTFSVKDVLRLEVAPALGCTEPSAIALSAAAAAFVLPEKDISYVETEVDPNIYKNAFAVSIPGTDGCSGLPLAAALGAIGGDPLRRLEVLSPITREDIVRAKKMVEEGKVKVKLKRTKGIFINTIVRSGSSHARCLIMDYHDNIVELSLNGEPISNNVLVSHTKQSSSSLKALEAWLSSLKLKDLINMLDDLDEEDLLFIKEGIETNLRLAEYGLKYRPGLGVGAAVDDMIEENLLSSNMETEARKLTSAAADARMSGVKLPAMSSAGSGNHGLTAILPIWAVSRFIKVDEKKVLKSIALSHIVTAYVKAYTGRLSAICGCSVAAGSGATAGITYMLGGDIGQIANSVKNLVGDLAGVICDGAKAGCSLKLATAASSAVRSALLSMKGVVIDYTNGIIGKTPEETMKNLGTLSNQGMIETDRIILQIMIEKGL